MIRTLFAALVLLAASAVWADPPKTDPKAEPAVQKYCPVMTKDEVDLKASKWVDYKGVKVYLCCDTCVARFKRDPAAYLDPKLVPGLAGKELPKRGIEQEYCPVYPDKKVSEKDPFTTYKGAKVYFWNTTAKERFERDPDRYLEKAVLPQLPKK
jgi:YHS domain-containing protein